MFQCYQHPRAAGNFIDYDLINKLHIKVQLLKTPLETQIPVLEGRPFSCGAITHHIVPIMLHGAFHHERLSLVVTHSTRYHIILSVPWMHITLLVASTSVQSSEITTIEEIPQMNLTKSSVKLRQVVYLLIDPTTALEVTAGTMPPHNHTDHLSAVGKKKQHGRVR